MKLIPTTLTIAAFLWVIAPAAYAGDPDPMDTQMETSTLSDTTEIDSHVIDPSAVEAAIADMEGLSLSDEVTIRTYMYDGLSAEDALAALKAEKADGAVWSDTETSDDIPMDSDTSETLEGEDVDETNY